MTNFKEMTAKQLRVLLITELRDRGYENYISLVDIYTHKVYEGAQEDAEEGHFLLSEAALRACHQKD